MFTVFLLKNQNKHIMSSTQGKTERVCQNQEFHRSYSPVKEYTDDIGKVLDRVTDCQMETLRQKYHYFFTKLGKQKAQHRKLFNIYTGITNFVFQRQFDLIVSNPVQEQVKGIEFIKMILKEVKQKIFMVREKQQIQQQIRNQNILKIQKLKEELKRQKDTYFKLKRQEEQNQQKRNKKQKELTMAIINKNFMKSAKQNSLRRQIRSIHTQFFSPMLKETSSNIKKPQRQIFESFDLIDGMKSQVINIARKTHKQNLQTLIFPVVSKDKTSNKSKVKLKKQLNFLQKTSQSGKISSFKHGDCGKKYFGIQVFRRRKQFEDEDLFVDQNCKSTFEAAIEQKIQFRNLKSEEVLQIMLKQGKMKQLLNIIDKQKKFFIQKKCQK